ncbi:FxLYD domain-containing protein [Aurantimonas sp. A2-1-M11]|uniref:FxLYD domain-containing protein n=1 Tax=Aurantimonas sp. A2-1-M11 TaxID=3113712 RepID=UPI002F92109A
MTEFRTTADTRRAPPRAIIIDGEAEVVSRQPLPHHASTLRQIAHEPAVADAMPEPGERAFGRRSAASRAFASAASEDRDLLRQASLLSHGASWPADAGPARESLGTMARRLSPSRAVLVVGGFLVGLLAAPVLLLSMPESPVAAPYGVASASGLVLRDVDASIAPRGPGAVLSVAGTIVNDTAGTLTVPTLRIALRDADGITRSRPLNAQISALPAGQSVRFRSALAVAGDTAGDMSVEFEETGAPNR